MPGAQMLQTPSGLYLPTHLFPPAGAQSKNLANYVTILGAGLEADIISFLVPPSMRLILNQIGNNYVGAGFTEGSGKIIWSIRDNNVPIEDFENIVGSLGNVALPTAMAPVTIEEGHTVSFHYLNVLGSGIAAGAGKVGATLRGYYYNLLQTEAGEWAV